jgi:hypothetical protein
MARWIMEWFTISSIGVFGLGIMYIMTRLWELIPTKIADGSLAAMELEGKIALTMLFVIVVGCIKLFSNSSKN